MPVITHTHVVGAGVVDYGELGIFPIQVNNDDDLQKMIANKHMAIKVYLVMQVNQSSPLIIKFISIRTKLKPN
jgi:hypothetical protein